MNKSASPDIRNHTDFLLVVWKVNAKTTGGNDVEIRLAFSRLIEIVVSLQLSVIRPRVQLMH